MTTVKLANASPNQKWFALSLQALVVLSEYDTLFPSCDIARKLKAEPTMLRKVMARLVKENILETREGRDGGYRLKVRPDQLTLADVYRALRMEQSLCSGMRETAAGCQSPCGEAFNDIAEEMDRSVLGVLERHTIAELAARGKE